MPVTPNSDHLTRLSLIRYLLRNAEEQTTQPSPLCSLALLPMHDAVEMFLDLAADALDLPPSKRDFKEYWTLLGKAEPPIHLSAQRTMMKLNAARVALKHHAHWPSQDQVKEHLISTTNFLEDACEACFGMALSEVSFAALVQNEKVRNLINDAQHAIEENDLDKAFTACALAFAQAVSDAHRRLHFSLGFLDLDLFQTRFTYPELGSALERVVRPIARAIEQLSDDYGRAIGLVSMGIDLRDYERFRSLTPVIHSLASTNPVMDRFAPPSDNEADAQWCVQFVIDFMLRIEAPGKSSSFERPISIDDIPV